MYSFWNGERTLKHASRNLWINLSLFCWSCAAGGTVSHSEKKAKKSKLRFSSGKQVGSEIYPLIALR